MALKANSGRQDGNVLPTNPTVLEAQIEKKGDSMKSSLGSDLDLSPFDVLATITLVNGECVDGVAFQVYAINEEDARQQVTLEYITKHVSDDWGMPTRNVTVVDIKRATVEVGS